MCLSPGSWSVCPSFTTHLTCAFSPFTCHVSFVSLHLQSTSSAASLTTSFPSTPIAANMSLTGSADVTLLVPHLQGMLHHTFQQQVGAERGGMIVMKHIVTIVFIYFHICVGRFQSHPLPAV